MTTLIISDHASREELTAAIAALKAKHDRLPAHWEARRELVMREIYTLIDRVIVMDHGTQHDHS